MAEKKEKQYVSYNARLMAEWDWEKNVDLDPTQLTVGSGKKSGGNVPMVTNGKRE